MDTVQSDIVTAASVLMQAEMFPCGNGLIMGTLHSKYLSQPYEFFDPMQMLEKMEEIFDEKKFPEAFLTPRTLNPAKTEAKGKSFAKRAEVMKDMKKTIEQTSQNGKKCTFEISVKFRQNATWQGTILWIEKNLKQNFRSVLEMLKLMDEALSECAEESVTASWAE